MILLPFCSHLERRERTERAHFRLPCFKRSLQQQWAFSYFPPFSPFFVRETARFFSLPLAVRWAGANRKIIHALLLLLLLFLRVQKRIFPPSPLPCSVGKNENYFSGQTFWVPIARKMKSYPSPWSVGQTVFLHCAHHDLAPARKNAHQSPKKEKKEKK